MAVATAISVAISHSSRWSSRLARTRATRAPGVTSGSDAGRFEEIIHDLLAHAALGLLVDRLERGHPRGALLRREVVQGRLAGRLDLRERVDVLLLGDAVAVVRGVGDRLLQLPAHVRRQAVPELRVRDQRVLQVRVAGDGDVL